MKLVSLIRAKEWHRTVECKLTVCPQNGRASAHRQTAGSRRAVLLFLAGLVFCSLVSAAAAGMTGPAPSHAPTLLSLRLVPAEVNLWGQEASQRFVVLGTFADGLERDLTLSSKFQLSDSDVAAVDEAGTVVAIADGEAVLQAESGEQEARASIRIEATGRERPFRFDRDIASILTRRGCNDSHCHGSVIGSGGFKLSLDALYPQEDYEWIVQGGGYQVLTMESDGPRIPRVSLEEPEQSQLLLKPTMQVSHGGGLRFDTDSSDYQTILNWVKRGAGYGSRADAGRIERVEVFPREVVLDQKGAQRLLVTAYTTDGRSEDISHEVRYLTQNPHVVKVSEDGLVSAVGSGETSVLVRAAGHAVSARIGVVAAVIPNYPQLHPRNLIDEHVFAKLRRFQILPSELSTDAEFLRRVCLDVTGMLPPPHRVREFLASRDPQKREKLIEILLISPQYVDYWSFRFADLLRVTFTAQPSLKIVKAYDDWVRNSIVQNKPYDQMARERIAAQGFSAPSRYFYRYTELIVPPELMSEQVRLFMGRRLDCAQCHNHPFEIWSQDQFWGLTAFFGNLTQLLDASLVIDNPGGGRSYDEKREGAKVIHPRRKEEVKARFLDGASLDGAGIDPRMALAEWMISQPSFAETAVNRIWGYFFSRGIVDPVDDFKTTNPPTHPELLAALGRDFAENGYDLKHLMRLIARSRTYQSSGISNHTNRRDQLNYSRALPRPLEAAVLLDAISFATGVPEKFEVHPKSVGEGAPRPGARAVNLIPELFPCHFLDVYQRSMRKTLPSGKPSLTLTQALHMWAGPTYTTKIVEEGGRLDRALKDGLSDPQIIEEFYLAALSRYPTEREETELVDYIGQGPSRSGRLASLMWALLSSREFAHNH